LTAFLFGINAHNCFLTSSPYRVSFVKKKYEYKS